ncbi:MAG: hypothetical protein Q8O53_00425 [Candidatus Moranbacteria bacterium]|nr:hypothetical protein [Candidatus Moranbacteria bacterium]
MTKNFKLLLKEAQELQLAVNNIYPEKEVVEISDGKQTIIVKEVFSLALNPASASSALAKNKEITYRFWEREGIPFPRSRYFRKSATFSATVDDLQLQFPVVFKKSNGKKSIGIHTNVGSFDELAAIVKNSDGSFIVQEMVFGKEYRLLVYKDRLLGALELVPPQIIGNGVDTIATLIERKNIDLQKKIIINGKVIQTLEKNNLSLNTIPAQQSCVLLQENSCLAEGGSSIDCTEIVHKDMLALALKSARATNMKLAGIDIICEDIALDPRQQKVSFLETNSFPSLSIHYDPTVGKPRRVIRDILADIFTLSIE